MPCLAEARALLRRSAVVSCHSELVIGTRLWRRRVPVTGSASQPTWRDVAGRWSRLWDHRCVEKSLRSPHSVWPEAVGARSDAALGPRLSLVWGGGGRENMCMEAWVCVGACVACVCVRVCSDLRVAVFMVGPARYSGAGIRLQPREHAFLLPFSTRQGFSPAWMVYRGTHVSSYDDDVPKTVDCPGSNPRHRDPQPIALPD